MTRIKAKGHVLVAGPCFYPLGQRTGYGGMERLASLVAEEMAVLGWEVDVVGGARSQQIEGCRVWRGPLEGSFFEAEQAAWQEYGWLLGSTELVVDFSHSHLFRMDGFPGISWIWHDPYLMQPKVPSNGVFALSKWQAQRHFERTRQQIGVCDPICADTAEFFFDKSVETTDRWFSLGIFDANKGQKEAALLAEKAGICLDLGGRPVDKAVVDGVKEVEKRTHGRVRYLGELVGEAKTNLMRSCRGMLYWPSYPEGFGEAHSHKLVEALMMGKPCVVRDQGAMREVFGELAYVTPAWDGALMWVSEDISCRATARWSVQATTSRILDAVKVKV